MKTESNSKVLRIVPLLIAVCLVSVPGQAEYGGGSGTAEDPYQISTAEDLMLLGESPEDYDKHFILTADIDLSDLHFGRAVIAPDTNDVDGRYQGAPFSGHLDGQGHRIHQSHIEGRSYLGLFGQLDDGAQITNLSLVDANVVGTGSSIGLLVGYNSGRVSNCYSTGSVIGGGGVGGLVGRNAGSIANCYSTATVSGEWDVGGLVGQNYGGTITSSFWDMETSDLTVSDGGVGLTTAEMMDPYMLGLNGFANDPNWVLDAGRDYPRLAWEGTPGQIIPEPIIDWLDGQGTEEEPYRLDIANQLILLSRASGLWDKHFILGADIDLDPNLPGRRVFSQAVIQFFSGVFEGDGHTISHLTIRGGNYLGLFGELASGAMVFNLGLEAVDVSGTGHHVGGLVGDNAGSITSCYSTGSVGGGSGGAGVGGLVGINNGSVSDCYSTGSVSGDGSRLGIGGLVGSNDGTVTSCYSSGKVGGQECVGGLVGPNYGGITSSFWDMETSGQATSGGGTGATTAEMQTAGTFLEAGWDFVDETANGTEDVWWILEGQDYPRLWWEWPSEN